MANDNIHSSNRYLLSSILGDNPHHFESATTSLSSSTASSSSTDKNVNVTTNEHERSLQTPSSSPPNTSSLSANVNTNTSSASSSSSNFYDGFLGKNYLEVASSMVSSQSTAGGKKDDEAYLDLRSKTPEDQPTTNGSVSDLYNNSNSHGDAWLSSSTNGNATNATSSSLNGQSSSNTTNSRSSMHLSSVHLTPPGNNDHYGSMMSMNGNSASSSASSGTLSSSSSSAGSSQQQDQSNAALQKSVFTLPSDTISQFIQSPPPTPVRTSNVSTTTSLGAPSFPTSLDGTNTSQQQADDSTTTSTSDENGDAGIFGTGNTPSRFLVLGNLPTNITADKVKAICKSYGAVRSIFKASATSVVIVFYDIRHAFNAFHALKQQFFHDRQLSTWFGDPGVVGIYHSSGKDLLENQGELLVSRFMGDDSDLWSLCENYGDVRFVKEYELSPTDSKIVEFHDVRAAEAARSELNGRVYEGVRLHVSFYNNAANGAGAKLPVTASGSASVVSSSASTGMSFNGARVTTNGNTGASGVASGAGEQGMKWDYGSSAIGSIPITNNRVGRHQHTASLDSIQLSSSYHSGMSVVPRSSTPGPSSSGYGFSLMGTSLDVSNGWANSAAAAAAAASIAASRAEHLSTPRPMSPMDAGRSMYLTALNNARQQSLQQQQHHHHHHQQQQQQQQMNIEQSYLALGRSSGLMDSHTGFSEHDFANAYGNAKQQQTRPTASAAAAYAASLPNNDLGAALLHEQFQRHQHQQQQLHHAHPHAQSHHHHQSQFNPFATLSATAAAAAAAAVAATSTTSPTIVASQHGHHTTHHHHTMTQNGASYPHPYLHPSAAKLLATTLTQAQLGMGSGIALLDKDFAELKEKLLSEDRRRKQLIEDLQRQILSKGLVSPELWSLGTTFPSGSGNSAKQHVIPKENEVNLYNIIMGLDKRTTFMIRNIPNKYTQQMLLDFIDETHKGEYDFFYLRMDFRNRCNVGYAFINFFDVSSVLTFAFKVAGKRWYSLSKTRFNSDKICMLSYANIQGKQALIEKFRNSSVMLEDETYRPKMYYSSGPYRGQPEPFPPPTIPLRRTWLENDQRSEEVDPEILNNLHGRHGHGHGHHGHHGHGHGHSANTSLSLSSHDFEGLMGYGLTPPPTSSSSSSSASSPSPSPISSAMSMSKHAHALSLSSLSLSSASVSPSPPPITGLAGIESGMEGMSITGPLN